MMSKCPICDKDTLCTEDYIESYILLESHELCPDNHYWIDWVTGYGSWGFQVNDTFYVDYITSTGGILFKANNDDIFDEFCELTTHEVEGYLRLAKINYGSAK